MNDNDITEDFDNPDKRIEGILLIVSYIYIIKKIDEHNFRIFQR
jgi:hypothetical protein